MMGIFYHTKRKEKREDFHKWGLHFFQMYGMMALLHKISYYLFFCTILEVVFCFGKNAGSTFGNLFYGG